MVLSNRLLGIFILIMSCFVSAYAVNEGTPNLSFEEGDFTGWDLYLGEYYLDEETGEYVYDWESVASTDRIKVMNTVAGTMDPTIACADFYVNPDGVPVARIGKPNVCDLYPRYNYTSYRCQAYKAAAEKMVYKFKVTEETALLTYKFALVLADPVGNASSGAHTGEQLPQFSFNITSVNEETGLEKSLSCSEYSVKVGSEDLENNGNCHLSTTRNGNNPIDYRYKNWTTGAIDLSNQIGNTVTIDVWSHDCLVEIDCGNGPTPVAGGHEAWGYFWAETKSLELKTRNCGNENPVLEAPEGFHAYKWSRSDGLEGTIKTPDEEKPWIVEVDRATIVEGVVYTCEVLSEFCGSYIKISAELDDIEVMPDFVSQDTCGGRIKFESLAKVEGDQIYSYSWDFGDSTYSVLENPQHDYTAPGKYTAKLTVLSAMGCKDSIKKDVVVRYFPNLEIEGNTKYCIGDNIDLEVLEAETGSDFLWSTGDTEQKIQLVAEESQYFSVKVTDRFSCEYEKSVYVSVFERPTVRLRGDLSVCYGDTATLIAGGASSYTWSVGTSGDSLRVRPLSDTKYTVVGTSSNGCSGTADTIVTVLPLPVVTIEGEDEVCVNNNLVMTAQGAETYIWEDLFTGGERTIVPSESGLLTYTVKGIDSNNCSSSVSKNIYVKDLPVVLIKGDSVVCEGEIARQEAIGAESYIWQDSSSLSYLSKKVDRPETWTVTGTSDGCSVTVSKMIYTQKPSNVWIDGIPEICKGDTLRLVAVGAESYEWSDGSKTDSLVSNPTISTTYQLVATSENGCKVLKNIDVKVNPNPVVSIKGDLGVCANTFANLEAISLSGDIAVFHWDYGANGAKAEPLVTEETTYTVRGEDLNGCVGTASHTVAIIAPPKVTFSGDTLVCKGDPAMIVASGAASYVWHDGSLGSRFVKKLEDSELFTVTASLNGCSIDTSILISVLPSPSIWVDGNTSICPGDSLYLTVRGAKKYLWNASVEGENYKNLPTVSSKVSVIGESENGCVSKLEVPFTVLPRPEVGILGDESVCRDGVVSLMATGRDLIQYEWSTGSTGKTMSALVPQDTTFSVTAWNELGCSNVAYFNVTTIEPPVIGFEGDTSVCVGEDIILYANGATNFKWRLNGAILQEGDRLNYQPNHNVVVTLEGTESNCTAQKDIRLKVNSLPNVNIIGPEGVCKGYDAELTATGADYYEWNSGDTTASVTVSPIVGTSYIVKGITKNGCSAKKSIKVDVYRDLNVSLEEISKSGCPGAPTIIEIGAQGALTYSYSSEPYNITISGTTSYNNIEALVEEPTEVYVVGTDHNGCQGFDTLLVKPKDSDNMTFKVVPTIVDLENRRIVMIGDKPNNAEWQWKTGDGADWFEGKHLDHVYSVDDIASSDSFLIVARATDEEGCIHEKSEYIYVWKDFWNPTAFSPDGDGLNDMFRFKGGEYVEEFNFTIYDRTGMIIFQGHSIDDVWDGNYSNGEPCPQGVYGWSLSYSSKYKGIDKQGDNKGFVTLLR
jgi:gliding motility-associated-like protein